MVKEAAQARLSLHLSKCHIIGNHMSRLKCCQTLNHHMRQEDRDAKVNNIMKLKTKLLLFIIQ